jgi:prefoldin subunit 5
MTTESAVWKLSEMLEVKLQNVTDALDAINSNIEAINENLELIQETLSRARD